MPNPKEAELGILGPGQLAMMTGHAASALGITAIALGPGENTPASFAMHVEPGDFNNPADVRRFSQLVESLALDTDFVRNDILQELQREGLRIVPNADLNNTIQNRIRLKSALNEAGVTTAEWYPALSQKELVDAFSDLGGDVIVKTTEEGFDGRGNKTVSDEAGLEQVWQDFGGREMIVEKRLAIEKEVAMMVARGMDGNVAMYPLVESFHKDGILEYTFLPAMVDQEVEDQAREMGNLVLNTFEGPGLIGVEFIKPVGAPLVLNEIAGRPHNTGHYTIDACVTSQFANLVKIASGQKVGEPTFLNPEQMVLMHNLNFGWDKEGFTEEDHEIVRSMGGRLEDYHKPPRPGSPRKRAHMTLFGADRRSLMANANAAMRAMHYST